MSIFSAFGNIIGRPLSWFTGGGESTSSANIDGHGSDLAGSDAAEAGSDYKDVEPYEPSITDVLVVKAMLNKALSLPPELLNTILDLAEYWPHSTSEWSGGPLSIYGGRRGREDVFLVRTTLSSPCRAGWLLKYRDSFDRGPWASPKPLTTQTSHSTTRLPRPAPNPCTDSIA
jgi:hypothetical protein